MVREKACLAKGTLLLRHDHSTVAVEDVKEGDLLLGPDGKPRRAFNIVSGEERLYRIKIGNGKEDLVVTPNHILVFKGQNGDAVEIASSEDQHDRGSATPTTATAPATLKSPTSTEHLPYIAGPPRDR